MSLAGVVGWIVARGPSKVELPSRDAIYDQPVDEAITLLRDSGLEVGNSKDIGCSVTVEPGYVRQVTVGSEKNVHVLYGKSTDTIDEAASASLQKRRPGHCLDSVKHVLMINPKKLSRDDSLVCGPDQL